MVGYNHTKYEHVVLKTEDPAHSAGTLSMWSTGINIALKALNNNNKGVSFL